MPKSLVFISGASSGIGAAMADRAVETGARVINISRRSRSGCEHFQADLSSPAGWSATAGLFEREMKGFDGARIVFVHSAGTLEPIGFAGEVPADAYERQVLINSAAPQVLGEAFVRASHGTAARCQFLVIGSGAASNLYPGWSAYGPGKAAANQWVRTVAAELDLRGSPCEVYSIAPGIVATAMQEHIRSVDAEAFPDVSTFIGLHEDGELRDASVVALELWDLLDGEIQNGAVLDLRDATGDD
jgi:benzil reductase ((S)-benzoin forming)